MSENDVTIRECVSVADFQQCIDLERAVWKDDDIGIMPIRLYLISKACKAPTIGAFDQSGRLVGFVHTMLALVGREVVYHSHLAAVVEDLRHKDIGFRMKLAQRQFALAAGIPLIIWTFDPLQSRNAHLNINKLGAIIRRYEINYYGEGLSSVFDSGVPSDRIFSEWWVASPHVEATLAGERPRVTGYAASVMIPDDINVVRACSVEEHLQWRLKVREDFSRYLTSGLIVKGFDRDPQSAESRYLFGDDESQFHFDAYRNIPTAGMFEINGAMIE
jgi:predicted GNAT superfamily acetyltransferase